MNDSDHAGPPAARGALLNRAQMAAILGIAKTTLDEWVRRGCPVHRPATGKGVAAQFDTASVIRWRADELSGHAGPALERERARLAAAQASLAEMKLAAARGELLPAEKVSLAVTSAFTRVRTRLLAIPPKAAPRLVGKVQPAEIQALLADLVEEALRELSETQVIGECSDGLAYADPT